MGSQATPTPTTTTPNKRFSTELKNVYTWPPATRPQSVLHKVYTLTSVVACLALFDGVFPLPLPYNPFLYGASSIKLTHNSGITNSRILSAIGGAIFNVTARRSFYGPDGIYGNFAGRDASRGMAKQSFDVGEYFAAFLSAGGWKLGCYLAPSDRVVIWTFWVVGLTLGC